ncbi:hypothetical protein [Streptomyces sp. NPDC052042]|uniref:hypothetical protein n=1 Tax=Streptomyces sp. NPDC052042 TaxID=3365683 RepID=UPI0037CD7B64
MAGDAWDQLRRITARQHTARTQIDQLSPRDGSKSSSDSVTGGMNSSQQAWNKAGAGVGGLRKDVGKALTRLADGQQGLFRTIDTGYADAPAVSGRETRR